MKRLCFCIACLALVSVAHGGTRDLTRNGDFEAGERDRPRFWYPLSVSGSATYTWPEQGRGGGHCLRIDCDNFDSKASWAHAPLRVVAGGELDITGYIQLKNLELQSGFGFRTVVHFYGPTGYITWTPAHGRLQETAGDAWEPFEHCVTVPPGATHARVSFRLARSKGTLRIDDVKIMAEFPDTVDDALALPAPIDEPRLKIGLIADPVASPAYQFADHLARQGVATRWLQDADLEPERFAVALESIDVLVLGEHVDPTGHSIISDELAQSIVTFVERGGGLLAMGVAALPDSLAGRLPVTVDRAAATSSRLRPAPTDNAPAWLKDLPGAWPIIACVDSMQAPDGAIWLRSDRQPVLIASRNEHIAVLNTRLTTDGVRTLLQWRYSPVMLARLLAWLAGDDPTTWRRDDHLPGLRDVLRYMVFGYSHDGFNGPLPQVVSHEASYRAVTWPRRPSYGMPDAKSPSVTATEGGWRIDFGGALIMTLQSSGHFTLQRGEAVAVSSLADRTFPELGVAHEQGTVTPVDDVASTGEPQVAYSSTQRLADAVVVGEVTADGDVVRVAFDLQKGGELVGRGKWKIERRDVDTANGWWSGVAMSLDLADIDPAIAEIEVSLQQSLAEPVTPMRLAGYSTPRGPFVQTIRQASDIAPHNVWYFNTGGQPFHFASTPRGGMCSYFDRPQLVRAELCAAGDAIAYSQRMRTGARPARMIDEPTLVVLLDDKHADANDWLDMRWMLMRQFAGQLGVDVQLGEPAIQARIEMFDERVKEHESGIQGPVTFDTYGDIVLPLAVDNHFKMVDIGSAINLETLDEQFAAWGGEDGLRRLTARFAAAGVDPMTYWRITFWAPGLPVLAEHPDWPIREREGKAYVSEALVNLSMRSGYRDFAEATLRHYMDMGIKGVWFDSLSPAAGVIDYGRAQPYPQLYDVNEHFATMRREGLRFWVEGMSSIGVDSHWFRYGRYGDSFDGNEYMLFNSTLFATRWDTALFIDYFKAASVMGAPMIDVTVIMHEGDPMTRMIACVNRQYHAARDAIGSLVDLDVHDWGTVWRGSEGSAVFAWEPIALSGLPGGATLRMVSDDVRAASGEVIHVDGGEVLLID